jgi:hypothetical protein
MYVLKRSWKMRLSASGPRTMTVCVPSTRHLTMSPPLPSTHFSIRSHAPSILLGALSSSSTWPRKTLLPGAVGTGASTACLRAKAASASSAL